MLIALSIFVLRLRLFSQLLVLGLASTPRTFLLVSAQNTASLDLVGTWSSKSRKVLTGPAFFDYRNENLREPQLPGISYSFTANGFYESAYYRSIPNPVNPSCVKGLLQWQHGSWSRHSNGSLYLKPFATDGRQLLSDPCRYPYSIYSRFNQSEFFQRYHVHTDDYHKIPRLDLYKFNGVPLMPLYLVSSTPYMLPTRALTTPTKSTVKPPPIRRWIGSLGHSATEVTNSLPVTNHPLLQYFWSIAAFTVIFSGLCFYLHQ